MYWIYRDRFVSMCRIVAILSLFIAGNSMNASIDHSIWDRLLKKHVTLAGKVDYAGLRKDKSELIKYTELLATVSLQSLSQSEKMAYWVNTYNAFTVQLILDQYPVTSIRDLTFDGKMAWDHPFILLHGTLYTLNHIEHEILRKQFFEPGIHFVLNCAAVSCPRLINYALTADNLKDTMDKATKEFIADKNRNRISPDRLELSKIFEWYREDFEKSGSLVQFIQEYTNVRIKKSARIIFLEYDWSLNGK